jgi:hypothetical protein
VLGIFLFSTAYRPALGLAQSLTQWVPGVLSPWVKRSGREANHSLLEPRSRIRGAVPPTPMSLWCDAQLSRTTLLLVVLVVALVVLNVALSTELSERFRKSILKYTHVCILQAIVTTYVHIYIYI